MMHRCSITQRGADMVLQCTCSLLFVGTLAEAERLRRAHVSRMRELEGIYAASISRAHGRAREAREAEMVAAMAAETRKQAQEAQREHR